MKKLSISLLADTVIKRRKAMSLTQSQLSKLSGINRSVLSNLESRQYTPSIDQLQSLAGVLGFEPTDMFVEVKTSSAVDNVPAAVPDKAYNIAIAGTGYVGLSLAVLLAQHNNVTAVDIVPEKVEKINNYISPIQESRMNT